MCVELGTSITTPLTPVSAERFTSSAMQRAKLNTSVSVPSRRFTISRIAASSDGETTGIPASMRCTPVSARASAIRIFSSLLNMTPACCSPSRSVTSWILGLGSNLILEVTSPSKFHGLVNHISVFQGSLIS